MTNDPADPAAQQRGDTPLVYAEITHEDYAVQASSFTAVPTRGGVVLCGLCPRCTDTMEFPHVSKVHRRFRLFRTEGGVNPSAHPAQQGPAPEERPVPMACTCSGDHPGRPPGGGRLRGLLERRAGTRDMSLNVRPGPPADPADRLDARKMQQLVKNELPRVREAALAWRNGVGVLPAGLVGFGLVKGRSDVSQLASPYDAVVGGIMLLSLLAGTGAVLLLLRAAHGRPASVTLRETSRAGGPSVRTAT